MALHSALCAVSLHSSVHYVGTLRQVTDKLILARRLEHLPIFYICFTINGNKIILPYHTLADIGSDDILMKLSRVVHHSVFVLES